MAKRNQIPEKKEDSFAQFISEPPQSVALVAFALIALVLALLEFSRAF